VRVVATTAAGHFRRIAEEYDPSSWAQVQRLAPPLQTLTDEEEWRSYRSVHGDPVLHIEVRRRSADKGGCGATTSH
jgi:hypothetical protein